MAEEVTTPPAETQETEPTAEDQRVPYERFQQANKKAKDAADKAKALEQQVAELREQMEQAQNAGLPELDQVKGDLKKAQKRAEEAEQRATEQEQRIERSRRERLVAGAASDAKVKYPDLLVKDVDLDSIESEADATRAVKAAVKKYPDLVQSERPDLPGRVLENGRTTSTAPGAAKDPGLDEAEIVAGELQKFLASRGR